MLSASFPFDTELSLSLNHRICRDCSQTAERMGSRSTNGGRTVDNLFCSDMFDSLGSGDTSIMTQAELPSYVPSVMRAYDDMVAYKHHRTLKRLKDECETAVKGGKPFGNAQECLNKFSAIDQLPEEGCPAHLGRLAKIVACPPVGIDAYKQGALFPSKVQAVLRDADNATASYTARNCWNSARVNKTQIIANLEVLRNNLVHYCATLETWLDQNELFPPPKSQ